MGLVIRASDGAALGDAHGSTRRSWCESELSLSVEGGVIRYEVVPVPPYEKRYAEGGAVGRSGSTRQGGVPGRPRRLGRRADRPLGGVEPLRLDRAHRRGRTTPEVRGRSCPDRPGRRLGGRAGVAGDQGRDAGQQRPGLQALRGVRVPPRRVRPGPLPGAGRGTTEVALFWYLHFRESPGGPGPAGRLSERGRRGGRRVRATRSAPSTFVSSLRSHGVGPSTLVSPLVEAPAPLVGDAEPQGLGQVIQPVLAIAGDRPEVVLQ